MIRAVVAMFHPVCSQHRMFGSCTVLETFISPSDKDVGWRNWFLWCVFTRQIISRILVAICDEVSAQRWSRHSPVDSVCYMQREVGSATKDNCVCVAGGGVGWGMKMGGGGGEV